MSAFRFTIYFEAKVLLRRPYLRREQCIAVVLAPVRTARQPDGRWRSWAPIAELGGRVLRVVTLADQRTVHNAFRDRRFRP